MQEFTLFFCCVEFPWEFTCVQEIFFLVVDLTRIYQTVVPERMGKYRRSCMYTGRYDGIK